MFTFKHPKYYKELRKLRNKLDPVISLSPSDGWVERALDPGPKLQAPSDASFKQQASSPKQQASSFKPQASSSMIREPRNI